MAKIVPLFSGSKGNSYYIGSGNQGVLIDAGRNCKQLEIALNNNNIDINSIGAVFVTHEHSDHCSGLNVLAKRYGFKVYASQGTLEAMEGKYLDATVCTEVIADEVAVGDMLISRCNTSHDAAESCIYRVTTKDGRNSVVATDMGIMTDEVRDLIRSCDLAVVESNHDVKMLHQGLYPYNVKKRILSNIGHLSNDSCASELAEFIRSGVTRLLLGHISENNNLPALALNTNLQELEKQGLKRDVDFTLATVPPETLGKSITF